MRILSDALEFFGPFKKPFLARGLVVRSGRDVGHLVDRRAGHFAGAEARTFTGLPAFCL